MTDRLDLAPDLAQIVRDLQKKVDRLERAPKANTPGTTTQLPTYFVEDIYKVITSGTFAPIIESRFGGPIPYECFAAAGNIVTQAGTTAEYRLRIFTSQADGSPDNDQFTVAFPVGDGESLFYTHLVDMSEYWNLGVGASVLFQLEARRVTGSGNVYVYVPNYLYLADEASFSGNPATPIDDLL